MMTTRIFRHHHNQPLSPTRMMCRRSLSPLTSSTMMMIPKILSSSSSWIKLTTATATNNNNFTGDLGFTTHIVGRHSSTTTSSRMVPVFNTAASTTTTTTTDTSTRILSTLGSTKTTMIPSTTSSLSNRFRRCIIHFSFPVHPVCCFTTIYAVTDLRNKVSSFSGNSSRSLSTGERRRSKRSLAIERNKRIGALGRQRNWKDILYLYEKESDDFDNVNYATMFVQLATASSSMDTTEPLFLKYMDDLATKIVTGGLKWIGIQGISNIINSIGKMKGLRSNDNVKNIIRFTSESENANDIVSQAKPQAISIICWGMAKYGDKKSFSSFYSHVEPRLKRLFEETGMQPQTASNLAYSCVESGVQSPKLFELIEKHSTWLVENGTPQVVANTAWACATLDKQSPNLFSAIEKNSTWLVENGTPQNVANTAWACATLGIQSPNLFAAIDKHPNSTWLVENGTPQAVANTAWACATLGIQSPNLFSAIEKHSTWLVENGTPQQVANTAWSCATLGYQSPNLFVAIEKHSTWLVENGTPQEVANTAWSCATLGYQSPNLFAAIEKNAAWLVENGTPQNVANTAWACASLGYQSPNLFAAIEKNAARSVENGTPQAVSNTALAFATQGIPSKEFFRALMKNLNGFLEEATNQAIFNVCYSIAIVDLATEYPDEFCRLWSKALSLDPQSIEEEGLRQLAQTYVFVTAAGLQLQQPTLPSDTTVPETTMSKSQREVGRILTDIEFEHKQEVCPFSGSNDEGRSSFLPTGMLAIDFACPKSKIAIEFDGPSHYLINKLPSSGKKLSNVENGMTKAKRRFLERLGWKVYNIRYTDWYNAKGKKAKQLLLRSMLNHNRHACP